MSAIQAVLFDAVGTLMHPDPPVAEAYHAVGRRFGSLLSADEIAARFPAAFAVAWASAHESRSVEPVQRGLKPTLHYPTTQDLERRRWQAVVATVFDDLPDAAGAPFDALWEHFSQPCHWRLFDDVAPTWRELTRSGLLIGIASNFDDRLAGICRGLAPLDACEHVFWSSRVGWSKPAPEFFAHIERELNLSPHELLLVGDDYANDYLGATAAGWHGALITREERRGMENEIGSLLELAESAAWNSGGGHRAN